MTDKEPSFKDLFPDVQPLTKPLNKVRLTQSERLNPAIERARRENAEQFSLLDDSRLSDSVTSVEQQTGESQLSFCRAGLQKRAFQRLKQGKYPIEATLDMHGMKLEQAHTSLAAFVKELGERELRSALVVHGKGYNNPDQQAVLKTHVAHWLLQMPAVLAYHSASPRDGGAGAVYVLVRKTAK